MRLVTLIAATLSAWACTDPGDGSARPGASDGDAGRDVFDAGGGDVFDAGGGDVFDAAGGDVFDAAGGDGSEVGAETLDPSVDIDVDTIPDGVDNCVGLFNPDQADADGDGIGNVCDPENDDRDGDAIPNLADPFPDDAARPGVVLTNTVYAHTASELYKFGVKGQLEVELIGAFDFPSGTLDGRMTDIAIDRYGVMWGIGFEDVFIIDPTTAECWRIASLPQSFNGLTLVPKGVLGTTSDALIGVALDGGWWRMELVHAGGVTRVQTTPVGNYGSSWQSSGDAFSIEGVGTFASVDKGAGLPDQLVSVDPATGLVTSVVAALAGYTEVWGLAGWAGRVYAFDAGGDVLVIDLATGAVQAQVSTGKAWWGAGVRTVLDE